MTDWKQETRGLFLQTSAETLLQVSRDPQHLGARIDFFSVLQTWNQQEMVEEILVVR